MRYTNLNNRLNDDVCTLKTKNFENNSIIDSRLYNFYYNKDCSCPVLDDVAFDNNFTIREGYGFSSGCTIDADSELRLNSALTHNKGRIQLCSRSFVGVPNVNKGGLIPNLESRLRSADDTSDIRNVDKLAEKNFIPLSFTPMIQCLNDNIQNPKHLIESWQRGGADTRQDAVSAPYLEHCGFEKNGKNWVRRESK
jgi:hypothetical protein